MYRAIEEEKTRGPSYYSADANGKQSTPRWMMMMFRHPFFPQKSVQPSKSNQTRGRHLVSSDMAEQYFVPHQPIIGPLQ